MMDLSCPLPVKITQRPRHYEMVETGELKINRQSKFAAEYVAITYLIGDGFSEERVERVGRHKTEFDIRAHQIIDIASGESDGILPAEFLTTNFYQVPSEAITRN